MKFIVFVCLLIPTTTFAWQHYFDAMDSMYYGYTTGIDNSKLVIRRLNEDHAEGYIEAADKICQPKQKNIATTVTYNIDLDTLSTPIFGLVTTDGTAMVLRFPMRFLDRLEDGEVIEFAYDDCVYEFSITGDPTLLFYKDYYAHN